MTTETTTTGVDIDAIRQREQAATPGPWKADGEMVQVSGEVRYICDVFGLADKWPTAEFIAHARQDIPALLAKVDELKGRLDRVRQLCDSYKDQPPPIFQGSGLSEHGEGYNVGTRDMARAVLSAVSTADEAEQVAR